MGQSCYSPSKGDPFCCGQKDSARIRDDVTLRDDDEVDGGKENDKSSPPAASAPIAIPILADSGTALASESKTSADTAAREASREVAVAPVPAASAQQTSDTAPAEVDAPEQEEAPIEIRPRHSMMSRQGSDLNERGKRTSIVDGKRTSSRPSVHAFPHRPLLCKLSQKTWDKLQQLFEAMDTTGANAVTWEDALLHFSGGFGALSAQAMFNEVDTDKSGAITAEEFMDFWQAVAKAGYKEGDINDELDELIEGGSWVDWDDNRNTETQKVVKFPKRPFFCRLSGKCWAKCEQLFRKMDVEKKDNLSIDNLKAYWSAIGNFGNLSAEAMFNEIDVNKHGAITSKEYMAFWVQVRSAGYKESQIMEELDNLLEGGVWVDWNDGRTT